MTFEEWWNLYYGAWDRYRNDAQAKGIARDAWEAAYSMGEGKQLVGAHGSLMDKLGEKS